MILSRVPRHPKVGREDSRNTKKAVMCTLTQSKQHAISLWVVHGVGEVLWGCWLARGSPGSALHTNTMNALGRKNSMCIYFCPSLVRAGCCDKMLWSKQVERGGEFISAARGRSIMEESRKRRGTLYSGSCLARLLFLVIFFKRVVVFCLFVFF